MDETYTLNEQTYINPTVDRDERLAFIENLRAVQNKDMDKIKQDTYNLGSPLPSNKGGLTGAEGTFRQMYSVPQTNALVSQLKSAAQASALNTALSNLQNQYKDAYNTAYKNYQSRMGSYGNTGPSPGSNYVEGDVEFKTSNNPTSVTADEVPWDTQVSNSTNGYQLLDGGAIGAAAEIKGTWADGTKLIEGGLWKDPKGNTYVYTNGKVYLRK